MVVRALDVVGLTKTPRRRGMSGRHLRPHPPTPSLATLCWSVQNKLRAICDGGKAKNQSWVEGMKSQANGGEKTNLRKKEKKQGRHPAPVWLIRRVWKKKHTLCNPRSSVLVPSEKNVDFSICCLLPGFTQKGNRAFEHYRVNTAVAFVSVGFGFLPVVRRRHIKRNRAKAGAR